jgi:Uncharacterized conserved protein (DUF2181)
LEEWLKRVIAHSKKGIKLDFKTIEVAQAAIPILNKYKTGVRAAGLLSLLLFSFDDLITLLL